MEPQDCYYDKKPAKKRNCFGIIATILLGSLAVVIGLIIGANIAESVIAALSSVIVLAVVLGLLLILTIVFKICKKDKKCC